MPKYSIKSDRRLNPALKKQVVGLRSGMMERANKYELPKRFLLSMNDEEPGGSIKDLQTGRTTQHIPLFALAEVKQAIKDLFG